MKNLTVNVVVPSFVSGDTVTLPAINIKAKTNVIYKLSDIVETSNAALYLDIDWGDGTPIVNRVRPITVDYREANIIDEIVFNRPLGSILIKEEHTYYNNTSDYVTGATTQLLITYSNAATLRIIQPIQIFQASYYDDIGDLDILSAQILPLSSNNTILNLEGKVGKYTYVATLDTYNKYGVSPLIIDDNNVQGCNIIDLYGDYEQLLYDE